MALTYERASAMLETARDRNAGKPIANHTRLMPRERAIAVRLHETDIVTLHEDGAVTLNTGGWRTVTTKARMNDYAPVRVWSDKGTWYAGRDGASVPFADGITFWPDGSVSGAAPADTAQTERKLRARVGKYAAAFTDALFAGEVPAPSNGDCWGCLMRSDKGERPLGGSGHILAHLDDAYYVPSLLANAVETCAGVAVKQTAHALMQGKPEYAFSTDRASFIGKQIQAAIRKHCLRDLGMSA